MRRMSSRTSQLQIRVTPGEKETLKRLARAEGRSVSAYVLSQALPSASRDMAAAVEELATAGGGLRAAGPLWTLLRSLTGDEIASAAAQPRLSALSPRDRNLVAALVEEAACEKGVDPPDWVRTVPPLDRPHFGWALESLKPHQLRVTPAPFKARNLFFDPATRPGGDQARLTRPVVADEAREGVQRLLALRRELEPLEVEVEFYIVAGTLMYQAFRAQPRTAHVSALLEPSGAVREVAGRLAAREGWAHDWLTGPLKRYLTGHAGRYVELPGVRALVPPIEYVLSVRVAALRMGRDPRVLDDVRYLLRAANVDGTEVAHALVTRYFSVRQLSPETKEILQELVGP
jgi:hypothetical protein